MQRYLGLAIAALCAACAGSAIDGSSSGNTTYAGPFSGLYVETTNSQGSNGGPPITCQNSYSLSGTLTMHVGLSGTTRTGTAQVTGTEAETGKSGDSTCPLKGNRTIDMTAQITGTNADLQFTQQSSAGTTFATNNRATFSGTLATGVITGSLTWLRTGAGTSGTPGTSSAVSVQSTATVTMPVTLR